MHPNRRSQRWLFDLSSESAEALSWTGEILPMKVRNFNDYRFTVAESDADLRVFLSVLGFFIADFLICSRRERRGAAEGGGRKPAYGLGKTRLASTLAQIVGKVANYSGAAMGGPKRMMGMGRIPTHAAAASASAYMDARSEGGGGGLGVGGAAAADPMGHELLLAQQLSQMSPLTSSRGGISTASSGTNPLYEHSRRQEQSAVQPSQASAARPYSKPSQVPDPDLGVGSLVQVQLKEPLYGIIRWIGYPPDQPEKKTAGLEMEEELSAGTDGVYIGTRYFTCPPKKGLFIPLHRCSKDKRYNFSSDTKLSNDFGGQLTPDITGDEAPPEVLTQADLNAICGKNRGIQGHHNSCYLDATLFSMFYFTTVFDNIYNRPANTGDLPEYPEVQRVLKEGIVNPLRKFNYVRADKVLKLRELLDKLGTVPGMMGEEKDPEEFLNALLTQIMKADPILQLSSGQHAYFYQLFIEEDEKLLLPTTQKLVELSFLQGNVKLKQAPPCLMIQMPRFGKDYKMFHRIVPSLELDITHIVENCPRDCIVCGGLATYECKDCYQVHGPGLNTTAFCELCVKKSHQHMSRRSHQPKPITTTEDFLNFYKQQKRVQRELLQQQQQREGQEVDERNGLGDDADIIPLPRETMELFAVICIQTSHYVSFVKCGLGRDAPWVFFDSMADRMGEQGGYNIPEVVHVPKFADWLDKSFMRNLHSSTDDKELPEHLRRVLCDGYMCMYQSPTLMMYQ
ncbi:ubiquitin carboxyl-terminal hydrolase cyld [Plakobranchus ocellatus]|uniref:ubiquitinyl hydrolase 1 n=1 Tax=Plakobranchus ocellatus TaxID=259542 RepID=A0AAV4BQP2_9GAST|nr:ubiquitin carboxyl-terminal hydrolase cyld [Plakobranchus ocellatus]